ncbi:hypothetical protein J3B02_000125 [Coemansia erecta]|uniref:Sister chromatid cohesion protein DCC1 n=1 Tax=Coemansia asiatica TaxID=1052880 RepID=A0A9W7XNG0_9FUNG|nr:hypothetical protein LPJ64_000226 [Coemansia asiatica]KAJ2858535.1 hypothetical protein J3B02_000125 [Coemansia erecta]KAJ2889203.1 hypothetical protein FB639_000072 [Coemansia asiatica]
MASSSLPSDKSSTSSVLGLSASDGYPEECRLIELPPEIVAQLEAAAQTASAASSVLRVRGRDTDIATLVDLDDNTYHLHTAHTSNNLYLLSFEQQSVADTKAGIQMVQLRSKVNQTLELHRVQPQIRSRVLEVLQWDERGPFRGVEFDRQLVQDSGDSAISRVTDAVLAMHVQAGDRRLRRVLADIPAFREMSTGHWRSMDAGYCMDLLRLILATQIERDWSLDALDAKSVFDALRADAGGEYLLFEAVDAVLARFGRPINETTASTFYCIESRRVEKFLAEQIFAAENMRAWPVPEFLLALHETMPPQLRRRHVEDVEGWGSTQIPESLVRDLAYASTPIDSHQLYSIEGVPPQRTLLNPLFRSSLPQDPRERIGRLFEIRPRWSKKEIRPFLEDLVDVDPDLVEANDEKAVAAVSKAIDAWMIKFGRGVKGPSGDMVYTSRIN